MRPRPDIGAQWPRPAGMLRVDRTRDIAPSGVCDCPQRGHEPKGSARARAVRCPPDIVAKVENRTTLKISRKSIFGLLCRCVAFQRHSEGPPKKTFATISLPKRTSSVRPVRSEKCHKQKWAIFDHLTRADEQRRRHGEAERFGSFNH